MGRDVVLVSSADETAFDVAHRLARGSLARLAGEGGAGRAPGRLRFISSGDITWFEDLGRRLLGPELAGAEAFRWDRAAGRG
jgi:glutamate racemase